MSAESNRPRYSELYEQKYLDAFPPEPILKLNEDQVGLLSELACRVDEITREAIVYSNDESVEIFSGYELLENAMKRWDKPVNFADTAKKLREENPGLSLYEVDPEKLGTDEAVLCVLYPFGS